MFRKGHPRYPGSLDVHISRKELINLYTEEKKTPLQIAQIYHCCDVTIYKKLKDNNIPLRVRERASSTEIKYLYIDQKKTLREVAKAVKCGSSTVIRRLEKMGAKRRPAGISLWTPERCKKLSRSKKGKPSNSPTKFKKGDKRLMGKANPAWKGGVTPAIRKIRTSIEYEMWRMSVFVRDNWTCRKCGKRSGDKEAHHIKSFKDYPELRFAIDNGLTVCGKCHSKIDKHRRLKNVKSSCS